MPDYADASDIIGAHRTSRSEDFGTSLKDDLYLLPSIVAALYDIEFAEGTCGIDVQPFIYAGTVKMVATGKLAQLNSIIIR